MRWHELTRTLYRPTSFASLEESDQSYLSNRLYGQQKSSQSSAADLPSKGPGRCSLLAAGVAAAWINLYTTFFYIWRKRQPLFSSPARASTAARLSPATWGKLLGDVAYADPIWLNIPGAMLDDDAQVNAEYIAYAINYVSGICKGANVSIISWSQGGLDTQWALTFWPSSRAVVSDFISVSPDFHGTIEASRLCVSAGSDAGELLCDPAVTQQEYDSQFVRALRGRGGANAYVPTTTVCSALFDRGCRASAGHLCIRVSDRQPWSRGYQHRSPVRLPEKARWGLL